MARRTHISSRQLSENRHLFRRFVHAVDRIVVRSPAFRRKCARERETIPPEGGTTNQASPSCKRKILKNLAKQFFRTSFGIQLDNIRRQGRVNGYRRIRTTVWSGNFDFDSGDFVVVFTAGSFEDGYLDEDNDGIPDVLPIWEIDITFTGVFDYLPTWGF